ncbi:hypothetical protein D3C72_2386520 [compost metagenome]
MLIQESDLSGAGDVRPDVPVHNGSAVLMDRDLDFRFFHRQQRPVLILHGRGMGCPDPKAVPSPCFNPELL